MSRFPLHPTPTTPRCANPRRETRRARVGVCAQSNVSPTHLPNRHTLHRRASLSTTPAQSAPPGISRERFAALYEEHSRLFWVVAASVTGDRTRAADIVQDAAIVAMGKLDQFHEGTSFQAWMCQIVRYVALNDARKMRPVSAENEHLDATQARPPTASRAIANEAFSDEVVKALATLDPTARECVLLKVIFDWPYARIAELLDIPEGTAMSHVHRSRGTLRKLLAASYGGVRSGGPA